MFKKILKKRAQIKNTLLSTLISTIIKKMFVSPEVSNAFYAIEQWLEFNIYITVTAHDGTDFQNIYL